MPMRVAGLEQTLGPPPEVGDKPPLDADPSVKEAWREQMLARDQWRSRALDAGYDPQTILAAGGANGKQGGGGLPWLNALREQAYYGKGVDTGFQYDWGGGRKRRIIPGSNNSKYYGWEPITPQEQAGKAHADAIRGNMSQAEFERSAWNINPGEGSSLLDASGAFSDPGFQDSSSHANDFGLGRGNWDPGYWNSKAGRAAYFAPDTNTRSGGAYTPGTFGADVPPDGNYSAAYGGGGGVSYQDNGGSYAPAPTYAVPLNQQTGPTANRAPAAAPRTSVWGTEYNNAPDPSSYTPPSPSGPGGSTYNPPAPTAQAKKNNIGGAPASNATLPSSGYAF